MQSLDLITWPKQNSRNKNPQPPVTFLMVRPLLTFKLQTNTRKNQLKQFTITFIVSVFRILNVTYNAFGKRYKPIHFCMIQKHL